MKFTYKAEGAPEKVWLFKAEKMLNVEAEAIERVSGIRFPEWTNELLNGRISAVHALLWVLLKRDLPTLTYDAVTFTSDEYDLDFDDDEKVEILREMDADVAAGGVLTPPQIEVRADLFAAVGHLLEPVEVEAPAEVSWESEEAPKESEPSPAL